MPTSPKVYRGEFVEGVEFYILDRPVGGDGSTIFDAEVTSYVLNVYDVSEQGPGTLVHTETTSGLTEFSSLQTDGYWTKDATGYSMRLKVTPASWSVTAAEGGKQYKLELLYTTSSWGTVKLLWLLSCRKTLSS